MRWGGSGSSSARARPTRASARAPLSASHSARSLASASAAFSEASATSRRFEPRSGTWSRTPLPRCRPSTALSVSASSRCERQQNGSGRPFGRRVVLLQERGEHFVIGLVAGTLGDEVLATDHLPVADDEDLHARLVPVSGQADDVMLLPREGGHLLLLDRPLHRLQLVPGHGSGLVPQCVRIAPISARS